MKILLVRLRLIGDVVFTTPLLRALKRRYPQAHLTYVVEPAAAPVVLSNPHLDEVIVVPKSSGLGRVRADLATALQLRRERFDIAIDLHGGPRSAWLTRASGAPMRIGYRMPGRAWMYTHVRPRPDGLAPRHSVLNQWDLLAPLDVGACDPARDAVEMRDDAAAARLVESTLAAAGIPASAPIVVVHVSAGNPFRRWPADAFAALVATLARRNAERHFMIVSGPSEADAAQTVAEMACERSGARTIHHGEFDLAEVRALVARAAVYVGGDSGPLHVAATTRTPIVALFGPTLPERSLPWRGPHYFFSACDAGPLPCRPCHQRTCVPGDFRCLSKIPVERVAAAVEEALAPVELVDGAVHA